MKDRMTRPSVKGLMLRSCNSHCTYSKTTVTPSLFLEGTSSLKVSCCNGTSLMWCSQPNIPLQPRCLIVIHLTMHACKCPFADCPIIHTVIHSLSGSLIHASVFCANQANMPHTVHSINVFIACQSGKHVPSNMCNCLLTA